MTRGQDNIARRADDLLRAAGATREPVSLVDVVSTLNLSLIRAAREPFQSEAALVPLGDSHAIVLRGTGDERRRRFTIAHEIGHFVLHADRVAPERGGKVNQAGRAQERDFLRAVVAANPHEAVARLELLDLDDRLEGVAGFEAVVRVVHVLPEGVLHAVGAHLVGVGPIRVSSRRPAAGRS